MTPQTTPPPIEAAPKLKPLPTLWNAPDTLWELIEKVLAGYDPPNRLGRPRADARRCFDGIIFRLRTGCQWNHLPLEFGDRTTVYRAFVRWEQKGIFDILWAILLTKCDELQGVDWHWQSADGCLGKARGVPGSGLGKRGVRTNASVLTPATVASRASRKVSWSKAMAGPWRPASAGPTPQTPNCLP